MIKIKCLSQSACASRELFFHRPFLVLQYSFEAGRSTNEQSSVWPLAKINLIVLGSVKYFPGSQISCILTCQTCIAGCTILASGIKLISSLLVRWCRGESRIRETDTRLPVTWGIQKVLWKVASRISSQWHTSRHALSFCQCTRSLRLQAAPWSSAPCTPGFFKALRAA